MIQSHQFQRKKKRKNGSGRSILAMFFMKKLKKVDCMFKNSIYLLFVDNKGGLVGPFIVANFLAIFTFQFLLIQTCLLVIVLHLFQVI